MNTQQSATPNELTAQNQPSAVRIPDHILFKETNGKLLDMVFQAQSSAVSSLKPKAVLEAINSAYEAGFEEGYSKEAVSPRLIELPLGFSRHSEAGSHFQLVYNALSHYRDFLIEQSSDCDNSTAIADLTEIQTEMTVRVLDSVNLLLNDKESQRHV